MLDGGRLGKHARYYWLLLAEGHLNRAVRSSATPRSALAMLCGPMCTPGSRYSSRAGRALVTVLQGVPVLLLQARSGNPLPSPRPAT